MDVLFGVDYYDRGSLRGSEFDRGRTLDYRRWGGSNLEAVLPFLLGPVPATIATVDGSNLPGLDSSFAAIPRGQDGTALTPEDFLDTQGMENPIYPFSAFYDLWPEQRRKSVFGHARGSLWESAQWQFAAGYASVDTYTANAFPVSGLPVSADNPYNPFGVPLLASLYLDPIEERNASEDTFLMGSLSGPAWGDLRYEIGMNASRSTLRHRSNDNDLASILAALVASTPESALNIFGDPSRNDPTLTRSLRVPSGRASIRTQMLGVDLGVQGDVFSSERFKLSLASGGDVRTETLDTEYREGPDARLLRGADEDRDVTALYTELLAQTMRANDERFMLTLSAAARYEEYSDFGSKVVPKVRHSIPAHTHRRIESVLRQVVQGTFAHAAQQSPE